MTDLASGHITEAEAEILLGETDIECRVKPTLKKKNTQKRKLNPGRKK